MKPVQALWMALVAGALAVGLVALDVAFTLTARLETERGDWETVAMAPYDSRSARYHYGPGCATPNLRLTVDNHKPLSDLVTVEIHYWTTRGVSRAILVDTWNLGAFQTRTFPFTIPDDAFPKGVNENEPKSPLQVEAIVDGHYLSACVEEVA